MDDIVINKVATLERCLKRIEEEYVGAEESFFSNFTQQDAIILNLQRACETSLDLAARIVRLKHLGVPQSSRDTFVLLEQASIIPPALSQHLQAMVGFRNIAVHDYKTLNLELVRHILEHRLDDFRQFSQIALGLTV